MSAQTPRPSCLLSLEEKSELSTKIAQTFALADLLNCVYHGPSDGLNPESLEWISAMLFDLSGDVYRLWEEGAKRDLEARGVKAPAQDPEPAPRKLNHYTPGLANAKVSLKAMWGYLEDLELAADDPAKVSAWAEMIHDELGKCEAA